MSHLLYKLEVTNCLLPSQLKCLTRPWQHKPIAGLLFNQNGALCTVEHVASPCLQLSIGFSSVSKPPSPSPRSSPHTPSCASPPQPVCAPSNNSLAEGEMPTFLWCVTMLMWVPLVLSHSKDSVCLWTEQTTLLSLLHWRNLNTHRFQAYYLSSSEVYLPLIEKLNPPCAINC